MSSLVVVTERISGIIDDILLQENLPDVIRKKLTQFNRNERQYSCDEKSSITFELLHEAFDHSTKEHLYLHEILEGSEIYFPPQKQPERNPELLARLEQLKADQENQRYREMTQNVNSKAYGGDSLLSGIGAEVRSVKSQLMGVFNIVLTVVGAFTFGFMTSFYAGKPAAYCVVVGFAFGLITATADLYFFMKNEL